MDLQLDLIVYLRTAPEVSYERMRARNRKEEAGAPLSYLQVSSIFFHATFHYKI